MASNKSSIKNYDGESYEGVEDGIREVEEERGGRTY